MLRIFYGNDRKAAEKAIKKVLGDNYESVLADKLVPSDMVSVFMGTSIFGDSRKILIKDLDSNSDCWSELDKYLDTPHEIVLWNDTLNKKTVLYKTLSKSGVECKEFKLADNYDSFTGLNMLDAAMRGDLNGALKKFNEVRAHNVSALPTIAAIGTTLCKKYLGMNKKATRAVKILAQNEMRIKTNSLDEWQALEISIIEIAKL